MQYQPRKLIPSILLLIIFAPCCLFLYFSFISFPSTEAIAKNYLYAVLVRNWGGVANLGGGESDCQVALRKSYSLDIQKFGGAEIRNLVIEVHGPGGSDDEIQAAIINFEYREPNDSEWQPGKMQLVTDHAVPGFRYTCGNIFSH